MLQDAPWHGIGPGLFWLAYPPYRAAADNSGGFYVHNDYLQLWLEGGWPTFIVLLCLLALVAFRYARSAALGRRGGRARGQRPVRRAAGGRLPQPAHLQLLPAADPHRDGRAARPVRCDHHRWTHAAAAGEPNHPGGLSPDRFFACCSCRHSISAACSRADLLRMRAERLAPQGGFLAAHRSLELAERLAPGDRHRCCSCTRISCGARIARLPQDASERRESLYALAHGEARRCAARIPSARRCPSSAASCCWKIGRWRVPTGGNGRMRHLRKRWRSTRASCRRGSPTRGPCARRGAWTDARETAAGGPRRGLSAQRRSRRATCKRLARRSSVPGRRSAWNICAAATVRLPGASRRRSGAAAGDR